MWELRLHGRPLLVDGDGEPGVALELNDKDAAWLAYVALEGPAPSTRVGALVYPGQATTDAMRNLRQRIHVQRRRTGARLVDTGEHLSLASDLRITADAGHGAALPPGLLAGCRFDHLTEFNAWLQRQRETDQRRQCERAARCCDDWVATGEHERALPLAQALVAAEPLAEPAHRRLIRLHLARGDVAAARRQFDACVALLADELDVAPSAETLALGAACREPAAPQGVQVRAALLIRPPQLVARETELARAQQAVGDGAVAVVVGEAGLGKSRLLQQLAQGDPHAITVRARPGDAGVPHALTTRLFEALLTFAPMLAPREGAAGEALAALLPSHGAGAPAHKPLRVHQALHDWMQRAGASQTLHLFLDDVHFADLASLESLRELVQDDGHAAPGVGWVLALRPEGADGNPLLASLAESTRTRWIPLVPWTEADVRTLLRSTGHDGADLATHASDLHRHAGGNPLYTLETLREALFRPGTGAGAPWPVPHTLAHLIDGRLRRLSPAAAALMRVAAVAVPDFGAELAAQVLQAPVLALADAWRELEDAGVLRGDAFAHDLVHDAALRALPAPIARHLHGRVAAFLANRGIPAARLAAHWARAGEAAAAALAYEQAAALAARAARIREHGELLQQAAAQHRAAGHGERASSLLGQAVGSLIQAGDCPAAATLADAMRADAASPAQRDTAPNSRATVHLWSGQYAEAEALAREVLAAPASPALGCTAARMVAQALRQQGRAAEGLATLAPWMTHRDTLAEAQDRIDLQADYTSLLLSNENIAASEPATREALALAREHGDGQAVCNALINRCVSAASSGLLDEAVAAAREAEALLADESQSRSLCQMNRVQLGWLLGNQGHYAEALDLIETARPALRAAGVAWLEPLTATLLARLWLHLGQPAKALALVAAPSDKATRATRISRLHALALARIATRQDARAPLAEALALCESGQALAAGVLLRCTALRDTSPADRLQQWPALLHRCVEAGHRPMAWLLRLHTMEDALAATATVPDPGDLRALADGLLGLQACGPYRPELWLRASRLAQAADAPALQRRLLDAAQDWVTTAERRAPPAARESFRHRNPANVALLAAWRSRSG